MVENGEGEAYLNSVRKRKRKEVGVMWEASELRKWCLRCLVYIRIVWSLQGARGRLEWMRSSARVGERINGYYNLLFYK